MTTTMSSSPKKKKQEQKEQRDAEESFAKCLQRIQRISSTVRSKQHRPPNEADAADGRSLANLFVALANEHGVIPKKVQESTLMALVSTTNVPAAASAGGSSGPGQGGGKKSAAADASQTCKTVNPSVCQSFFDTVIWHCRRQLEEYYDNENRNNKSSSSKDDDDDDINILGPVMIQMDAWLPSWILYTEKQVIEQQQERETHGSCWEDDDINTSALDSLTIFIRAYSQYVQLKCIIQQKDDEQQQRQSQDTEGSSSSTTNRNNNSNNSMGQQRGATCPISKSRIRHITDLCLALVTKTFLKFRTQAARLSTLRCFIHVAFDNDSSDTSTKKYTDNIPTKLYFYRTMLTPLLTCSVLSNNVPPPVTSASSTLAMRRLGVAADYGGELPSMTEAIMCMDGVWRESFSLVIECMGDDDADHIDDKKDAGYSLSSKTNYGVVMDLMEWLTSTLDIYLLTIPSRPLRSSRIACKDFAFRWLSTLLELGGFIVEQIASRGTDTASAMMTMRDWFFRVMNSTIPSWFSLVPSYRRSMEPIWLSVSAIMDSLSLSCAGDIRLSVATILHLSTIATNHTIKSDVRQILGILTKIIQHRRTALSSRRELPDTDVDPITFSMLRGLGSMYLRDETCASTSTDLLQTLSRLKVSKSQSDTYGSTNVVRNLMQFSEWDEKIFDAFVRFASFGKHAVDNFGYFSAMQQSSMLMFGIGLLDRTEYRLCAFDFLEKLLMMYPHLGASVLPVMIDSINSAAITGEGDFMLQQMNFLCDVIIRDNQCAGEVWNLLGVVLMQANIPSSIRSSIIRLFPRICKSNQRLYKRVIDSMGKILAECKDNEHFGDSLHPGEILELRLTVAANVADLAREDRIRDPTDVIGWIQNFIFDPGWVQRTSTLDKDEEAGSAGLVHYAILALHYLVVAQEMDYKLVVSVLSKRLCNVHDLKKVEKLPPVVLESLILLLGDGEIKCDSDSDRDAERNPVVVPPYALKSVDTLIGLWHCQCLRPETVTQESSEKSAVMNCRRNIFFSLSKYSFDALGIDEEGIEAAANENAVTVNDLKPNLPETGKRYLEILNLVEYGIAGLATEEGTDGQSKIKSPDPKSISDFTVNPSFSCSLSRFVAKLIRNEEVVIGSSLWQKRSNLRRKVVRKQYGASPEISQPQPFIKSLPASDRILKIYNNNKCQTTALAVLLSFEGKQIDILMDLAGEGTSDPSNPLLQALYLQAWLNTSRSILDEMVSSMSTSEALDQVLAEIQGWRVDNPDAMYMCLSCIALLIPEKLGPFGDHSSYMKDIADDVYNSYKSHEYIDADIGKLCYGLVAVMDVYVGSTDRLHEIVSDLEKSVVSYGGCPSFGCFYSMALICCTCSILVKSPEDTEFNSQGLAIIRRIVSFLVLQLSSFIHGDPPAIQRLAGSINEGKISQEVLESLTTLKRRGLKIVSSKRRSAKSIFIALSICIPTLTLINSELLLGIYCVLDGLEWGSGKGFALPTVLETCIFAGLFESRDMERVNAKYAKELEDGMERGVDGFDDIFFAVTSIQSKPLSEHIRKFILGNTNLFNDTGRGLSLVSAVLSICTIPCLGRGTSDYKDPARLSRTTTDVDVAGVLEALSEAITTNEWNDYSQMATVLLGFMAGVTNSKVKHNIDVRPGTEDLTELVGDSQLGTTSILPSARSGTALEIVMSSLQPYFHQQKFTDQLGRPKDGMLRLLNSLAVLSLPGQFADFIKSLMQTDCASTKTVCVNILLSQTTGRPRAVFDGQDFVNLSLSICRSPLLKMREMLGNEDAAVELFISSFGEILPKFPSPAVEEAAENVFRFCVSQIGEKPTLTIKFLDSIAALLQRSKCDRAFRLSPKTIHAVQLLMLRRVFAGIRDSAWASDDNEEVTTHRRLVVHHYAKCVIEVPSGVLEEADFLKVKELDGFAGEGLRIQVVMNLLQLGYFKSPISCHSEIASAIAWMSRKLVDCDDELFSISFLHVVGAISESTMKDQPEKRRELFVYMLDNLIMVSGRAGFVALQVLAALVFSWCQEGLSGSDGNPSLLCILGTSIVTWQDLPPDTLKATFRVAVHDLPFNLARYARGEKLAGVAFNRLWRVYGKWSEQGVDDQTLIYIRQTLVQCRDAFDVSPNGSEDFVSLVAEMID